MSLDLGFLEEVKRYVGFTDEDARRLVAIKPLLERESPRVIDVFYDRILAHPRASRSITGGAEQVNRLKATLRRWLVELADGVYDRSYLERRAAIGRRHVVIELPQVFMVTAMDVVRRELLAALRAQLGDEAERERSIDALHKILDIDLAIMLETYQEDTLAKIIRSRYALMVDKAPLGMALVQNERYVLVNDRFARVFGAAGAASLVGRGVEEAWHPDEHERARARWLQDTDASMETYELRDVRRSDGQRIDVLCTRARLELEGAPAFQLLVRDVTDENRLSRELEDARAQVEEKRRLAALGEMVANIAHEIRNPLQGLSWGVKELRSAGAPAESVDKIERGIREANSIVAQVLDFARPMKADRMTFPTADLLEGVRVELAPLAEQAGVALVVDPTKGPREVFLDAVKVRQALVNLTRNAIEASHRGGSVHLRIEPAGSGAIAFVVEDEGKGLPPEMSQWLYVPFVTTKVKGPGLGLAVVRRIAEVHGGSIRLEPRSPKGTTARLEVPNAVGPA